MDDIIDFLQKNGSMNIIGSIVVIIISIIIYKAFTYFLSKGEGKTKLFTSRKGETYVKLLKSGVRSMFLIVTALIVLDINGIKVGSILAGVGVAGVIFGFAIQDWLKDAIRGSSIISDNYFKVGDIVKYKDIEGKVIVIGVKTTKIKDLATKNVISIANRNIEEIQVVSNYLQIVVPVPYEVKLDKAEKAMDDICKLVKKNNNVNDCKYMGVTELDSSSVNYLIELDCIPEHRRQIRRDALRSIMVGLDKNNIEVPYTQIDIHNK